MFSLGTLYIMMTLTYWFNISQAAEASKVRKSLRNYYFPHCFSGQQSARHCRMGSCVGENVLRLGVCFALHLDDDRSSCSPRPRLWILSNPLFLLVFILIHVVPLLVYCYCNDLHSFPAEKSFQNRKNPQFQFSNQPFFKRGIFISTSPQSYQSFS